MNQLPKIFAISGKHRKEKPLLWSNYINWLKSTYKYSITGESDAFYGANGTRADWWDNISSFGRDVVELTLEEWDAIVNPKEETKVSTQKITREALKEIFDVVCSTWKRKISEKLGKSDPFSNYIELTQAEVNDGYEATTDDVIRKLILKYLRYEKEFNASMLKQGEIMVRPNGEHIMRIGNGVTVDKGIWLTGTKKGYFINSENLSSFKGTKLEKGKNILVYAD